MRPASCRRTIGLCFDNWLAQFVQDGDLGQLLCEATYLPAITGDLQSCVEGIVRSTYDTGSKSTYPRGYTHYSHVSASKHLLPIGKPFTRTVKSLEGNRDMALRFVADAMLGRLAKWLRILGYDTLYNPDWDDARLVRIARAEDRILLTRDNGLARRKGACVILLEQENWSAQLQQLHRTLGLMSVAPFTRCPVCNDLLEPISKDQAWGQVPPYIFVTQQEFRLCPSCNRFYWRGSHWDEMCKLVAAWQ